MATILGFVGVYALYKFAALNLKYIRKKRKKENIIIEAVNSEDKEAIEKLINQTEEKTLQRVNQYYAKWTLAGVAMGAVLGVVTGLAIGSTINIIPRCDRFYLEKE